MNQRRTMVRNKRNTSKEFWKIYLIEALHYLLLIILLTPIYILSVRQFLMIEPLSNIASQIRSDPQNIGLIHSFNDKSVVFNTFIMNEIFILLLGFLIYVTVSSVMDLWKVNSFTERASKINLLYLWLQYLLISVIFASLGLIILTQINSLPILMILSFVLCVLYWYLICVVQVTSKEKSYLSTWKSIFRNIISLLGLKNVAFFILMLIGYSVLSSLAIVIFQYWAILIIFLITVLLAVLIKLYIFRELLKRGV